ncbi:MAG: hypothetical protein ABR973_02765 [Candidatus Acidiferrales bacterium]
MEPITFSVLGVVACAFLIYVLVRFHRQFASTGKRYHRHSKLPAVALLRVERALQSTRLSLYAGKGQPTRTEAVLRPEILISEIVGLFGLLAVFIFVMLLNSSSAWHH